MNDNQIAQLRKSAETAIQFGLAHGVTVEQLTGHMIVVAEVAQETGANLKWQQFGLGVSREELLAAAEVNIKRNKRSAGARALSAKYGKQAAEDIIARKTGKRINLQR